jgi:hypothetical protein
MDPSKATLVICLTIFVVIGINAAIYALIVHGDAHRQIDLFRKASLRARNPWESEDKSLEELSKQVQALKKNQDG